MQPGIVNPEAPTAPASTLGPGEAWEPLRADQWNAAAARHLLRRTGWSAQPSETARAVDEGLVRTLERLYPSTPAAFPAPRTIATLQEDTEAFATRLKEAPPEEKRALQKEARERSQHALSDMAVHWLQFAAEAPNAACEKWVLFLADVYVVSFEKVRNAALVHAHHALLRRHGLGPAPALTKAVSRSPAMIQYLDLQESKKDAPNENFARELFELFVLGEGNYSEADIKEAARAFTGYRQRFGGFRFARNQHDDRAKTIFGRTDSFDGDAVVDLAYQQSAAAVFLPRELARAYLTDQPLPAPYLDALGERWRAHQFELRALAHDFFGSRLFFDPAFRGNVIKSPVQFYLGLVQDLQLDVAPIARRVLGSLRQMGQSLFAPPNVRGWVGGRSWINSATLGARRQLVQSLFSPLNEASLNADEQAALATARAGGRQRFAVQPELFEPFVSLAPAEAATRLVQAFLPFDPGAAFRQDVRDFLASDTAPAQRSPRLRSVAAALLQSPAYQLC